MSVWERLRRWWGAPPNEPLAEPSAELGDRPARSVGDHDGELRRRVRDAALAGDFAALGRLLGEVRETVDEAPAIEAALEVFPRRRVDLEGERAADDRAPNDARDRFFLLLGDLLAARGDRVRALDAFARVASVSARIASADTLVDLVDRGGEPESLDQAMLELDRAMAIAPDAPGLRERWTRLRARLGRGPAPAGPGIGVTMLAPKRPLPFTLVAEVARGGAGVVYEARQALGPLGERTIALKLVHDRERQREELRREGAVAARLRGAGVIAVHDLDLEEGWLAMEWAAGGSLRARLSGGDAPPVGRWLPTLLETLASIHALGWVHGDVKPANVLFDGEGAPLLGDFGLARPIGAPATPGSAGYVSPERSAGAACSPADDVFGIGRLLVDVAKAQALGPRTRALADACVAPVSARPIDARALGALLLSGR